MAEIIEDKLLRIRITSQDRTMPESFLPGTGTYVEPSSMVLAIPSGGVPVGKVIAKELG